MEDYARIFATLYVLAIFAAGLYLASRAGFDVSAALVALIP